MKIALINENSQAAKNGIIEAALKKVVEPMGHEVVNYGMYAADDAAQLTYVQCGILAAILLNSGAADYVITGCGTGEGAMLALNSFPGVICGHVEDPVDAYTFAHVNDGNAVAMPFAKGFGWGGELNLEYCFEKLFGFGHGQGYPKERVEPEQRNKKILDGVRAATFKPLIECLKSIDQDLLKGAVAGAKFSELFFASCKDEELAAWGSVDALTRIYIHKWGMELAFLGYKKKIVWEDFSVIQRYKNHFFFNVSKQKDSGLFFSTYHPFTSFVIFDKSQFSCVRTMPISADEFCDLLTSYGVKYTESK